MLVLRKKPPDEPWFSVRNSGYTAYPSTVFYTRVGNVVRYKPGLFHSGGRVPTEGRYISLISVQPMTRSTVCHYIPKYKINAASSLALVDPSTTIREPYFISTGVTLFQDRAHNHPHGSTLSMTEYWRVWQPVSPGLNAAPVGMASRYVPVKVNDSWV